MEMFHEPTHWECPRCTLLCPVKFMRCTMCLFRKPRQKPETPPTATAPTTTTPDIPPKNNKETTKRQINFNTKKVNENVSGAAGILSSHKRVRDRVDKAMLESKKMRQNVTITRGDYTIEDMRSGLWQLVKGASLRQVQCDTKIPFSSLRRNFQKCMGFPHNSHVKISTRRWPELEKNC